MYARLIATIMGGVSTLTRYSVSRLGMKRFLAETVGFLTIDEMVDLAAEHSEWVAKNKSSILALSFVASSGVIPWGKSKAAISKIFLTPSLHSKLGIKGSAQAIASYLRQMGMEAMSSGCKITFNQGRDFLKVSVRDGKLYYEHSGHQAAAMLLAGGLGGGGLLATLENVDWKSTATQLSMILADLQVSIEESELATLLDQFDAVDLLVTGPQIVRAFQREHPSFPSELAASMLVNENLTKSSVFGEFSIDSWVDQDGVMIISVNGTTYMIDQEVIGGEGVLVPVSEPTRSLTPLTEEQEGFLDAIYSLFQTIARHGALDMLPVQDTSRFIATPIVCGNYAATLVWDESVRHFSIAVSSGNLFQEAADGLIDEYDTSLLDMAKARFEELAHYFGLSEATPVHQIGSVSAELVARELGKPQVVTE
jgi:hypothetical protein